MRIALVGWDLDDGIATELAGLGVDVVGFTPLVSRSAGLRGSRGLDQAALRPHDRRQPRVMRHGAFGVAVVRDAEHAGDRLRRSTSSTRWIAGPGPLRGELAARAPGSVLLASLTAADVASESGQRGGVRPAGRGPRAGSVIIPGSPNVFGRGLPSGACPGGPHGRCPGHDPGSEQDVGASRRPSTSTSLVVTLSHADPGLGPRPDRRGEASAGDGRRA